MWVPDGDATEPGFAVQKPSGRLSISAGYIGRDTTLYGVANDQNGGIVNAWPATLFNWNFCPNPRFLNNVTDGWTNLGSNLTRVLISAGNYVARIYYGTGGEFYCSQAVDEEIRSEAYLVVTFAVRARLAGCGAYFVMTDGSGDHEVSRLNFPLSGTYMDSYTLAHAVTSQVTNWKLRLLVPAACNLESEALDLTQVRVDYRDTSAAMSYRDGDMHGGLYGGWWWMGDAHNSLSRGPIGDG